MSLMNSKYKLTMLTAELSGLRLADFVTSFQSKFRFGRRLTCASDENAVYFINATY
jgi:hypothetical protein